MTSLSRFSQPSAPGKVWLVGAKPGDPGLTLHALNGPATADVVVYDALVVDGILVFAHGTVVLEFAGKRGGKPSAIRADITGRLIALAREGRRMLRLKGGDPFIFGRGGEEALGLVRAGIPFRIMPGVSSGLASLAIHGVLATTRDTNHAVVLATGQCAADEATDWEALARSGVPVVLYMAVSTLHDMVDALMREGLSDSPPLLAVQAVTAGREQAIDGTLEQLQRLARHGVIASPSVIAIGAIAPFRSAIANPLLEFGAEAAQ